MDYSTRVYKNCYNIVTIHIKIKKKIFYLLLKFFIEYIITNTTKAIKTSGMIPLLENTGVNGTPVLIIVPEASSYVVMFPNAVFNGVINAPTTDNNITIPTAVYMNMFTFSILFFV